MFEIDSESKSHNKIQYAAKPSPAVAAKIVPQFPKGKIDEKHDSGAYKDFMRGQ
jgi:hypothetical protein